MNYQEFQRLLGYHLARKNAPRYHQTPKRKAKSGNHLGQGAMLKSNPAPKGVYPVMTPSSKI